MARESCLPRRARPTGETMTPEIAIVLLLLVAAMVLFATELVSPDVTALGLLAALVASGILAPADAYTGFGSEIIIVLASVMVLAGSVAKSGVMEWLGKFAHDLGKGNERLSILTLLSMSAGSSALLSNTNTTAILMPAAIETARRTGISASRVLMPLAFASMLGGSATLIGTSANLAGSGMASRLGLEPFSLFEFAAVGAVLSVTGLLWLAMTGHWLLPARRSVETARNAEPRRFFTTLGLPEGSSAIDEAIGNLDFDGLDTDLLSVVRDRERRDPHHSRKLRAGDELIIRTTRDGLMKLRKSSDFTLEPDSHFSERYGGDVTPVLVEAVVTPQSRLVGQSLKQIGFFDRYRGIVLAVYRRERSRPARIENLRLRSGDVLLLQGPERHMASLRGDPDLKVLTRVETPVVTPREGTRALAAMAVAILVSALGLAPLSLAFLVAVLFVILAGNIAMSEAYRFIEWRLIVLIAAMSGFGLAMEESGTAAYLADIVVRWSAPVGPFAAMAGFSLLTVLLTQPMSNAAAALTVIPVAVAAADGLGLDPRMLAILVTLSASVSFISPLEPACLLVYDAGRYRFFDYARAGAPLTLICVTVLLVLVPMIW